MPPSDPKDDFVEKLFTTINKEMKTNGYQEMNRREQVIVLELVKALAPEKAAAWIK